MDILLGQEVENKLLEQVEKELFENRIIYLNEDISDLTIANIVPLIHKINLEDKDKGVEEIEPIKIFVTSYGGSAYDGWGLVSAIENSRTPIYTICETYGMSMGLPIFLSGHRKYLGKYATLLYHELRGQASGTRQEVKRLDKEYDRLQKIYDDYIIAHTTLTQNILNEHQEKVSDWYIGFDEAKKYSMFTHVFEGLHKIK